MGQSEASEPRSATVERGNPDRFLLKKPGLPDLEVVPAVAYDEMREARDHCKRQATEAGERWAELLAWLRDNYPEVWTQACYVEVRRGGATNRQAQTPLPASVSAEDQPTTGSVG